MFVLVIVVFFAVLLWLIVPPILAFWNGYVGEIERNAAPPR
jgi:hypothetical protein